MRPAKLMSLNFTNRAVYCFEMKLGSVKSGKGSRYAVWWDKTTGEIYVEWAGRTYIGKADNAPDAMTKAEAWLYNK